MKTKLICSMMAMSVVSLTAAAEDFSWGNVTFQPRAYMGYADYELKSGTFDFSFIEPDGKETSATGPLEMAWFYKDKIPVKGFLAGIGGTVATGRFFSDFYYQSTPNDTAYSSNTIDKPDGNDYTASLGSVSAKHSDWAISLGYIITDQWSVFAGYKSGNTEWDQGYQFNNNNPDQTTAALGKVNGQFDQDGPFLGTSYSFPIGPGALTIKAAYAYLDGEYKWQNSGYDYRPDLTNYSFKWDLDGNSNAYSLGISWTQSFTEHLGYSLGANYHRYAFDMSGTQTSSQANYNLVDGKANSGSLTEELFTLTASMFYRF